MSKSFVNNNGIYLHSDAIVVDDIGTTLTTELNNIKTTTIPISRGGTDATTAANARTNLGLGSLATQSNLSDLFISREAKLQVSISSNTQNGGNATIPTVAGYTPIAINGFSTGNGSVVTTLFRANFQQYTAAVYARNLSGNSVTTTFVINVVYAKNS